MRLGKPVGNTTEPSANIVEDLPAMKRSGDSPMDEWEQAEARRSALEAQTIDDGSLLLNEDNASRYVAPAQDTVFPLEYAFHLLGDVRGKHLLEYGCGSGENTILLARRGPRIHAIDISSDLIKVAHRRMTLNGVMSPVQFEVASAYAVSCPDESMDIVFAIMILHHLDLAAAAREIARVLRPGGRVIVSEPVMNSATLRALRKCIPYRAPDLSPFERQLTFRELDDFSAGFQVRRARSFELPWLRVASHLPLLRQTMKPWYRLDRWVLTRFPQLESIAGVRVFELQKP